MWKLLNALMLGLLSLYWGLVLLIALFVPIGLAGDQQQAAFLLLIVPIVVAYYVAIGVHESGHLLAALAVRFRPCAVQVGPLRIVREAGHFRLRLDRRNLSPTGGFVVVLPAVGGRLRGRMAFVDAAGPLTSLLVGASCLALLVALNPSPPMPARWAVRWDIAKHFLLHDAVSCGLCIASFWNLGLAFGSLVPARGKRWLSDGGQLLSLFWYRRRTERELELSLLTGAMMHGLRPRDWDPGQLDRLLVARDGSPDDAWVNLYGYYRAIDVGEVGLAGDFLDLAAGQGKESAAVFVEVAYFEGFHRRNPKAARAALRRARLSDLELHTYLRARAAVLLAEGNYLLAASDAAEALRVSHRSWDLGGATAECDWLQAILKECREHDAKREEPPEGEMSRCPDSGVRSDT
jgi:hypothetical protein